MLIFLFHKLQHIEIWCEIHVQEGYHLPMMIYFFFTMKISGILYNEMCIFDWLVINDCGQFDTNE